MTHPIEGGLSELISRLEAASEGSRELDVAMAYAAAPASLTGRYTTSLDAIAALIERKYPGQHQLAGFIALAKWDGTTAQSLALGLCVALLKALQDQQVTS